MVDRIKSAKRSKEAREAIYASGKAWPKGERPINPQRAQTAVDYYDYMKHASTLHIQAGAHLAMLEDEEHLLGNISYPQGHPRRSAVEAGEYYPQGEPGIFNDRRDSPEPERTATTRPAPEPTVRRSNKFSATCDNCGGVVKVGKGSIERGPGGYTTTHYPRCP